jgi:hypothetical protein
MPPLLSILFAFDRAIVFGSKRTFAAEDHEDLGQRIEFFAGRA